MVVALRLAHACSLGEEVALLEAWLRRLGVRRAVVVDERRGLSCRRWEGAVVAARLVDEEERQVAVRHDGVEGVVDALVGVPLELDLLGVVLRREDGYSVLRFHARYEHSVFSVHVGRQHVEHRLQVAAGAVAGWRHAHLVVVHGDRLRLEYVEYGLRQAAVHSAAASEAREGQRQRQVLGVEPAGQDVDVPGSEEGYQLVALACAPQWQSVVVALVVYCLCGQSEGGKRAVGVRERGAAAGEEGAVDVLQGLLQSVYV